MINLPTKIAHIDKLIANKIQEDLHLDYKQSSALHPTDKNKKEIAKDVSAFANSDGGFIIYGIVEDCNLPISKDGGVNHIEFSRERLEQIISSNITPRIDGLQVKPIPISTTHSLYVVKIPKSYRAPHQAKDGRYYKRYNFESVAMQDYEINDIRNRQITVSPLIDISAETRENHAVYIKISNIGSMPALNVTFSFPETILWAGNRGIPTLITNGTKYFPPNKSSFFYWNSAARLFHPEDSNVRKIDAAVTYLHPQNNQYVTDTFHIDLEDFRDSLIFKSDINELRDVLKESFSKLTEEIKKLNSNVEKLTPIAGSSGLDLSISTLRNVKNIICGDGSLEKINPSYCSYKVFQEVLDIDEDLAHSLDIHFRHYNEGQKLESIKNITPEIIVDIKKHFKVDE